jgi:tripartite-type tricarboxylate transporter receptor subunit TctC
MSTAPARPRLPRRTAFVLGGAALMLGAAVTLPAAQAQGAQTWPDRPVRLVIPFPAGGGTDLIGRALAPAVSKAIGQQIIVDNKAGAGGSIGSAEGAKAAPDGYTLLLTTSSTHAVAPHVTPKLPYDVQTSFTPIAHLADAASILLVTPSLPVKSVQELVAYAKAHPGQLNYASSGNGTIVHLTTEAFKAQAGVFITHVPYKGTGMSIPDLIAGNVHILFDAIPSGLPHVRNGRLRALAVTGPKRSALVPDLPTVAESGLPGYASVTWFGLYGPKGMDPALVSRIHAAFETALRSPEVVARLAELGAEPAPAGSPAKFAAMVKADSDRWGKLVRERGIKND